MPGRRAARSRLARSCTVRCAPASLSRVRSSPDTASPPDPAPNSGPSPIRCPARLASPPGSGLARTRASTASNTCSATVRPKRAIHAVGILSVLEIVPVAVGSATLICNGLRFHTVSVSVSEPSSSSSSSTGTETVFSVCRGEKVSQPEVAL